MNSAQNTSWQEWVKEVSGLRAEDWTAGQIEDVTVAQIRHERIPHQRPITRYYQGYRSNRRAPRPGQRFGPLVSEWPPLGNLIVHACGGTPKDYMPIRELREWVRHRIHRALGDASRRTSRAVLCPIAGLHPWGTEGCTVTVREITTTVTVTITERITTHVSDRQRRVKTSVGSVHSVPML
jgi:hypothetical protein